MSRKQKGLSVNENTKIHLETKFSRSKFPKRKFRFVINGILFTSIILSSLTANSSYAIGASTQEHQIPQISVTSESFYQEDIQATLENIRLAKVAIKANGLNQQLLEQMHTNLLNLEKRLNNDNINICLPLEKLMLEVENTLKEENIKGVQQLLKKRNDCLKTIANIKGLLIDKKDNDYVKIASASPPNNAVKITNLNSSTNSSKTVKYNDYKEGQYWSQDMLWAIEMGLIQGYINTQHPRTLQKGNWLDPQGVLTEGQFLTIMYRYMSPEELKSIKTTSSHWAAPVYELAKKNNLKVKGLANSNKPITRGAMAELFASAHFGKQVAMREAINWMYEANITNGYTVNGETPRTFASFGAEAELQRAHIVAFMKRYDEYVNKTSYYTLEKPKYGNHVYGSRNSDEYNEVLKIVDNKLKDFNSYVAGGDYAEFLDDFLNGERWDGNRSNRSTRNRALNSFENSIGALINNGVSNNEIKKVMVLSDIAIDLFKGGNNPGDGSARSAYDALVRKVNDCFSTAEVYSLVFDSLGYNTLILGGNGHAQVYIELGGNWYTTGSGSFDHRGSLKDLTNQVKNTNDLRVLSQPTYGPVIR